MTVSSSSPVRRATIQEELVPRKRQERTESSESGKENIDSDAVRKAKNDRGRTDIVPGYEKLHKNRQGDVVTTQPVSDPVAVDTPAPVTAPVPASTDPTSNDLRSLASQYVDQYSKQTGRTLTSEQRSTLVDDVYSFYSDPSRAGRLKSLVDAGA